MVLVTWYGSRGTERKRDRCAHLAFGDVLLESLARLLRQQQAHVIAQRVAPDVPARTLHRRRQVDGQTWNWVIGSPGQWVIWVVFHVRVTGSSL